PVQVLDRETRYSRTESPRHYPDNDLVSVTHVAAWVADAPPYGVVARAIGRRSRGAAPADRVRTESPSLENATQSRAVHDEGPDRLLHKLSGRRISSLIRFEDDADVGDLYTPAPRERACDVRLGAVRRIHRGPLRGELSLAVRITEPNAPRSQGGVDLVMRFIL